MEPTDISRFKRGRGAIRAAVTSAIKKADLILAQDSPSDANRATLSGLLRLLNDKLGQIEEVDRKVLFELPDAEVEKDQQEATTYQESIYLSISNIEFFLNQNSNVEAANRSERSSENSISKFNVKLPKLEIEPFDGDPLKFNQFFENFETSINTNDSLSQTEKFLYLRTLLKGPAQKCIEGLTVTESNYEKAVAKIKARFGDTKLLIATYVDCLMKLKPVGDSKNTHKLRKLFDDLETCIRNLNSLGIESSNYGPVLIPSILHKLPDEIRLEITKRVHVSE